MFGLAGRDEWDGSQINNTAIHTNNGNKSWPSNIGQTKQQDPTHVLSNEKREIYPITVHYYERSLLTSLLNRKLYECHNCCQRNIPCNEIRHSLLKIYEIVSEKAQYKYKPLLIEHVQYYKYYVRKF